MRFEKSIIIVILSLCFLSAGCTAKITRQGYLLDTLQDIEKKCPDVIIVKGFDYKSDSVEIKGKISASDTAFSTTCSEAFVMDIFKKDACTIGADIINITEESQPNAWTSTCYRAEAELLRMKDRTMLSEIKTDKHYSDRNISYRSKYSECLNKTSAIIAGIFIGMAGSTMVRSACMSEIAENDQKADQQPTQSSDKGSIDDKEKEIK
ncbi:MAG: hypothetical protein WC539_03045 [Nitrospirota bacterium]